MTTTESHLLSNRPSLVDLAAEALRELIVSGELRPGDRVVEARLTQRFGISRPPLREAMRVLEHEGLLRQIPRRGVIVTPLTLHDVYEIFTLRRTLERMAVDTAVPVTDPAEFLPVEAALDRMDAAAAADDRATHARAAFDFHVAVVGLAGHRRLVDSYRSLQLQMLQCMALNHEVRSREGETLAANVARHRDLVETIRTGDREAVHHAFDTHGDLEFVPAVGSQLPAGSARATAWLEEMTGRTS